MAGSVLIPSCLEAPMRIWQSCSSCATPLLASPVPPGVLLQPSGEDYPIKHAAGGVLMHPVSVRSAAARLPFHSKLRWTTVGL